MIGKSRNLVIVSLALLLSLILAGCEALPFTLQLPWQTETESTQPVAPGLTAQTNQVATPITFEPTPQGTPEPIREVILWLTPELDPNLDTAAARTLRARLDLFGRDHKINVVTRVKQADGEGGLLSGLASTHAAAPGALPDLAMMDREQLLNAVAAELVFLPAEPNTLLQDSDWYPNTLSLVSVEGLLYGVPIGIDPLVMAYDSATKLPPADDWAAIVTNAGRLGFAADDPQAHFITMLYLAMGGSVTNELGQPQLEVGPLTDALQVLDDAEAEKHISPLSLEYQTNEMVWQAFNAWNVNKAIVPISFVLRGAGNPSQPPPKPALTSPSMTLAGGYLWAITRGEPERVALASELLTALSEPSFLAKWTSELAIIPARRSAVTLFEHPTLKEAIEQLAPAALMYPEEAVREKIGPVLHNAGRVILQGDADPAEVAAAAVESVR